MGETQNGTSSPDSQCGSEEIARGSMSRGRLLGLTGGLLIGAAVTGPVAAARPKVARVATAQKASDTVTLAIYQENDSLDPGAMGLLIDYQVTQPMFDELMYKVGGRLVPGLAQSYKASADGKSFTFKLRKGVRFHDGTPFNAAAVKFNFDRIVNPKTKSRSAIGAIGPYKGSKVIDEYTVRIEFTRPNAAFLDQMTAQPLMISSPTAIKKFGSEYSRNPVGTGPFVFSKWTPGQSVEMTRNPNYWGRALFGAVPAGAVQKLIYRVLADPAAQAAALRTGEIDIAQSLTPQDTTALLATGKYRRTAVPATGMPWHMPLTVNLFPTDDLRVRRAILHAVNRDQIINALFKDQFTKANTVLDQGTPGWTATELYPYSPSRARDLLRQAGWTRGGDGIMTKNGKKLVLRYLGIADLGFDSTAQFIQGQLKNVGIQMNIENVAWPAVRSQYQRGRHNVANSFFWDVSPYVLKPLFSAENATKGENYGHYKNPRMEARMEAANAISDTRRRTRAWEGIARDLMRDAVTIPIHNKRGNFVAGTNVTGLAFAPNVVPLFNRVVVR